MMNKMDKYRLVNYFDVWGNEEEGFEVNNLCYEFDITVKDYSDHKEILSILIEEEFLKDSTTIEMLEFWNDYEMIEIFEKKNMYPLCRLELIRE